MRNTVLRHVSVCTCCVCDVARDMSDSALAISSGIAHARSANGEREVNPLGSALRCLLLPAR